MSTSTSRRSFLLKSALAAGAMSPLSTFGEGYETAIENTSKASSPSDLKITEIKCGYIRGGHSLFAKIHTNQNIWGCGEGVDATPGTYYLVKLFEGRIKGK
ncbi:MAG TPA: hypothetical protein VK517_19215, partial [Cyclobacteriaceae bacterium]|nr:hypothetical protein [Cyclobacteriaceae bacterium]